MGSDYEEVVAWKESAMQQLNKAGALMELMPMPEYWGWDVYDATTDHIKKLRAKNAALAQQVQTLTKAIELEISNGKTMELINRGLAQKVERFQTVTDYARCQSGSGPGDLQAYIERLWAEKAGLAQQVEELKAERKMDHDVISHQAQQIEELKQTNRTLNRTLAVRNQDYTEHLKRCTMDMAVWERQFAEMREALRNLLSTCGGDINWKPFVEAKAEAERVLAEQKGGVR